MGYQRKWRALSIALLVSTHSYGLRAQDDLSPLFACGFNLQVYAGVMPIIWANRGCITFAAGSDSLSASGCSSNCSSNSSDCTQACISIPKVLSIPCSAIGESIVRIKIPKFSALFATPWTVGTALGYAIRENQEVFAEFDYARASVKGFGIVSVQNQVDEAVLLQPVLMDDYKNVRAYLGYRYNFDRCHRISASLAGKLGVIHHSPINGWIDSSTGTVLAEGNTSTKFNLFRRTTSVSGAAKLDVDVKLNTEWSFLVGAECAVGRGPQAHNVAVQVNELGSSVINTGKIGVEVLFPVTFGLRYRF